MAVQSASELPPHVCAEPPSAPSQLCDRETAVGSGSTGGRRPARGPQRLWDTIECSLATWECLDQPGIATFRVTVYDNDALQYVKGDRDTSAFRWPLPL